jgi:predicted rRNA pseudouridine synthase
VNKTGHGGTLDPKVTGVLPIGIDTATRVSQLLLPAGKEYVCLMTMHKEMPEDQVYEIFDQFTGKIYQTPPVKSAVKRELRVRTIYYATIYEIKGKDVLFRVGCEAGTYIRTLCHDVGQKLGCGGCMDKLLRTKVGVFELADTLKLAEIDALAKEGLVEERIISVDELFCDYTKVWTKQEFDVVVHNGNRVKKRMFEEKLSSDTERLRVYDSKDTFIGIYEYSEERSDFKPVKMFYENH